MIFLKKSASNRHRRTRPLAPSLGDGRRLTFEGLEDRALMAVLYVAPSGSDSGPGSIASPFKNIQEAVTAANSGDQIRVASGVYTYSSTADKFGPRGQQSYSGVLGTTAVIAMFGKQISILGGYSTNNWDVADPKDNPTVIDGQGRYRGIFALGTSSLTSMNLDGFIIQNCVATGIPKRGGLDATYGFGGGIFVDMGDPSAQNQVAPWAFSNLVFINNIAIGSPSGASEGARGAGGAIALRHVAGSFFNNDVFVGNQAIGANGSVVGGNALGGAVFVDNSNVLASKLIFANNVANAGDGAGSGSLNGVTADALGGALSAISDSAVALFDTTAYNNLALAGNAANTANSQGGSGYGGAFYGEGADVILSFTGSYINNNQAWGGNGGTGGMGAGGAIETNSAAFLMRQSYVVGNAAATGSSTTNGSAGGGGGGGIYLTRYTGSAISNVTNSVIAGNTVVVGAGGNANLGGGGGGIWVQGVPLVLNQDTIGNNSIDPRLEFGQALIAVDYGVPTPSVVNIIDSIISDENGSRGGAIEVLQGSSQVNLSRVLSWNNKSLTGVTRNGVNGLNTVITANPSSTTPSIFQAPYAPNYNYHLVTTTPNPAINGARGSSNTVDIDDNPRDGVPDLGAAEATIPNVEFSGSLVVRAGAPSVINLVRHGDLTSAASVLVSLAAGGTARSGVDFAPFGNGNIATVDFAANAATATLVIPTILNSSFGSFRTLNLILSVLPNGGSKARIGVTSGITVTMVNNS
ncbi:hypothetical protein [Singulisphaera sp. PoT]|uniref:hypothetical protein n=1 Tax=Singulisphaera sp. PoT TaxID=3411797 RepID=UPI003BF460F7